MRTRYHFGAIASCVALVVLCLCGPLAGSAHARPVTGQTPAVRHTLPVTRSAARPPWALLLRGFSNWLVVWV